MGGDVERRRDRAGASDPGACTDAGRAGERIAAGDEVGVTPADYALDEVIGRLVGLDDGEVVIERSDERAGIVHVHFPRIGYHVRSTAAKKESR